MNGEAKMIERPSIRELIEKSVIELLESNTIEQLTVAQIAKNCGITARTFYNHFRDKYEVVCAVYTKEMRQHIDCSIPEWYGYMSELYESMPVFFEHALCYAGQNSLADAIIELEWEKLLRHIKPEVKNCESEYRKTIIAIEFMLYGNLGSLLNCYVSKKQNYQEKYLMSLYDNTWEWQKENCPPLVLKNLDMELKNAT